MPNFGKRYKLKVAREPEQNHTFSGGKHHSCVPLKSIRFSVPVV